MQNKCNKALNIMSTCIQRTITPEKTKNEKKL